MLFYTANDLIDAIKRNISVPTSQRKFSSNDFLTFLNEELELRIRSVLIEMKEDYFIDTAETSLVSGNDEYNLPIDAIGWKVDTIGYKDSSDNYCKIPRISRSQRGKYTFGNDVGSYPKAYYLEDSKVVVVPSVTSSVTGSLVFDFVRIHNELVLEEQCSLISSVTDTGTSYECSVNNISDTSGGVDVISGTNPFGIIARNQTAVVGGLVITIPSDNFEREPVAGDYVCATGETPIPNIPSDYHQALAQAAAIRCLSASNDIKGMQSSEAVLSQMLSSIAKRSSKRVDSSPKKIVSGSYVLNMMRGF